MPDWITCACGTVWSTTTSASCPVCGPDRKCRVCNTGQIINGACIHCDTACLLPASQCRSCRIVNDSSNIAAVLMRRCPAPADVDLHDFFRPVTVGDLSTIFTDRCPTCAGKIYPDNNGGMWCPRAECAWQSTSDQEKAA